MKLSFLLLVSIAGGLWLQEAEPAPPGQEAFSVEALLETLEDSGKRWTSFLDRESMNCGLYVLPAGSTDGQSPHELDEIYVVMEGKARLTAGDEEFAASPGSIFYVAAGIEHRFHDIEKDLTVVVVFPK